MTPVILEEAVALGQRRGHLYLAVVGAGGFPFIDSARRTGLVDRTRVAVEEWICPVTAARLRERPGECGPDPGSALRRRLRNPGRGAGV